MPEDQVKRSSVKLSILPVGRKSLMIRDGKQLLMLKALGGSRSVYSIEERGIPRSGITRSGKRHFQFSLPKFVNGLEGMNDHSQKSDHVVDQNLHSRVGSTPPKRGHFAKKSTGNYVKRTNHLKGSLSGKSGQQHSKQSLSSSAKKTLPNSSDDVGQTGSAQRAKNCNDVQSEVVRTSKSTSKREDGPTAKHQMSKEMKAGKASDTSIKHVHEKKPVIEKVVNQRSGSPVHPYNNSVKKEKVNLEAAKEVKEEKHNVGNKENHPKLKEAETSKEQPSVKVSCKQKTENVTSSSKEQTPTGIKHSKYNTTASTGNSTERNVIDGKEVVQNTVDVHSSIPDSVPSVEKITESDGQTSHTRSSKPPDKFTSMKENHSPKKLPMAKDQKGQRSSTPTPESPVKKSMIGRLSRKRHRSASPIAFTSSTDSKVAKQHAKQNVKLNRESIKLDSKNFEKVKNACKTAISQRKEKTSLEKGNSEFPLTQIKHSGVLQSGIVNVAARRDCREHVSEGDIPPAKKKKSSSTMESQNNTCENNNSSTVAPRSSDSEDGLTKLMKDFQSAMSSPSLKNTLPSTPVLKGNLRYISKKTSGRLNNGKTKTCNEQNKRKATSEKTESTKSVGVRFSSEMNNLQPEDISSDEDFGSYQETRRDTASKIPHNGDLSSTPEPCISPSKGNFLVVDEVGFTPDDSNSSPGIISLEDQTPSLNTSGKVIEQVSTKAKSSHVLVSDNAVDKFDPTETKYASPIVTEVEDAEAGQKQPVVETEVLSEDGKTCNTSTRVEVKSTQSTVTQTDSVEMKDVASEIKMLKPKVKDESMQFSSIPNSVDPEEITPIVTAMFESECEEKDRLKKALDEKIGKEEKWRNMVKDLCKQLRELRQQLAKKEPDKHSRDIGINTVSEASALPIVISTQTTQTEYHEGCAVSVKPDTSQQNSEGSAKCPAERIHSQNESVDVPSTANSNHHGPNKLDAVASPPSQVIISEDRAALSAANVAMNLTTTVQSRSADKGVTNSREVTENSTEVIDLTDSEDVNLPEPIIQVKTSPVPSRTPLKPAVNPQGLSATVHKQLTTSSKPKNTLILSNSKSPAKDLPHIYITGAVTSQAGLPQVPSLQSLQSEATMITPPVSSAQSIQRSIQRQIQHQFPLNRTSAAQMVAQLVATQSKQTVPPPLQPAPTIVASVYNKPQTSQLPILTPNLGMLVRTQTPQRQDVVLSGVSQQMMQHHGLTPLQQQQVKNSVLIEEFKRGMLQPSLATYPGSASIILPSGAHQVTTVPLRLPQSLPQGQSKKGSPHDEKRDGLQRQAYQAYQQKHLGNVQQLKAVLTEVEGSDTAQMQSFRNFKVTPSGIIAQAHRYLPPYSSATVQPVGHINTSTVHTQSVNALHQREVVNGVKQYVPLKSLSSQPRNTVQGVSGRTWFPNSRQGEIAGQLSQGTQHIINVDSKIRPKHPASLPTLQSSSTVVAKASLLPSPSIRISHSPEGVVLSWNITTNQDHPTVKKYFLYAYQVLNTPPSPLHWKRIGEVGALPPPMACTLNQFQPGSTYFLAICAVDVYDRPGWFSKTEEVVIPH